MARARATENGDQETLDRLEVEDRDEAAKEKKFTKKEKSLPILIMESELCEWDVTARMTLLVLALGARSKPDAWLQPDCPWTGEEMLGWCDMAQWRLAQRVGTTEDNMQRVLTKLEKKGYIEIETWQDSNKAKHNRYRIVVEMVKDNQRPSHKRDTKRPSRYSEKAPSRGRFTSENQPRSKRKSAAQMMRDMEWAAPVMADDENELYAGEL
jgi:hypothetical protein